MHRYFQSLYVLCWHSVSHKKLFIDRSNNSNVKNSGGVPDYFQFNKLGQWSVVSDSSTNYVYAYQGRNEGDDADGDNVEDGANEQNDGADDEKEEEDEDESIIVNEMNSGYDPYMAFDVGNCDTYAHLWTYDLLVSCADGDQHCECTFTEELMRMGLLSCSDESSCPDECGVCSNCIRSVCGQYVPSKLIASGVKNNAAIATAILFSAILLVVVILFVERRRAKKGKLNESLMDPKERNWMVSVSEDDGLPAEEGKKRKQVWLAPDVSTVPQQPLFPDLLKGEIEDNTSASSHSSKAREEEDEGGVELLATKSPKRLRPGPWLIPSSNASVPSSISNSTESDSYRLRQLESRIEGAGGNSGGRSIDTMEGEI